MKGPANGQAHCVCSNAVGFDKNSDLQVYPLFKKKHVEVVCNFGLIRSTEDLGSGWGCLNNILALIEYKNPEEPPEFRNSTCVKS